MTAIVCAHRRVIAARPISLRIGALEPTGESGV